MKKKHTKPCNPPKPPAKKHKKSLLRDTAFVVLVLALTALVYSGVRHYGFTNWDDNFMVYENSQLVSLSNANLERIFTPTQQSNEYQPLTTLSYALIYHFFGMEPGPFHVVSLMLHLLNVFLIFVFMGKLSVDFRIRYAVTFLFALHPLQVEAVAWISAHNYMLFSVFFITSCILYIQYVKSHRLAFYVGALLVFLPALLSKSTAVVLPVVLLTVDYFLKRREIVRCVTEKIPFFALSLLFGIIAMIPKAAMGAFTSANIYSWAERIFFAPYALMTYFIKLIIPFNLRVVYEFPGNSGDVLPILYYFSALSVIVLVILLVRFRKLRSYVLFGLLFLIANIFLVLHLIPFNHSGIVAERYIYTGAVGVFFALAYGTVQILRAKPSWKPVIASLCVVYGIYLVYQTTLRVKVWENSITLWTDQIEKTPDSYKAYYVRGEAYVKLGRFEEAYADFYTATDLNPLFADGFVNKGYVQTQLGHYEAALADYEKALGISPGNYNALTNKGYLLNLLGLFEQARNSLDSAIKIDPSKHTAYTNLAIAFFNQGQYEESLLNINKALDKNPASCEAFNNRGLIYQNLGKPGDALADFRNATEINSGFYQAYNNIGKIHFENQQYDSAIVAFNKAIAINKDFSIAFLNLGSAYYFKGNMAEACRNWREALRTGEQSVNNYISEYCQ